MSVENVRQAIRASSLDAARAIYLLIAALAVRQALLFLIEKPQEGQIHFSFLAKIIITGCVLFTIFRFTHGVILVYESEKKAAEASTTPSTKRFELIFAFLALNAVFLFLMSATLGEPWEFAKWAIALMISHMSYISVSGTLKDTRFYKLLYPVYWWRKWRSTIKGTAPRTHLLWAMSDIGTLIAILLSFRVRPEQAWAAVLGVILYAAGIADYMTNSEFYFGGKSAYRKRKCVFVCSPLKPEATLNPEAKKVRMYHHIRRAQWYCKKLSKSDHMVPFAPHVFYPYFLDDNNDLDRRLGRRCALEFLAHCDAIYLYTPNGRDSDSYLSEGMKADLRYAKEHGLEVKFVPEEEPSRDFWPAWRPLGRFPTGEAQEAGQENLLEKKWKRVFVCTPLRQDKRNATELEAAIKRNIRLAQWICHKLVRSRSEEDSRIAPFAPQAFYPFFTDYDENARLTWLESALHVLKICDALYVYTEDGMETDRYISQGMRKCIDEARALGMEIRFCKTEQPPPDWNPKQWSLPTILEKKVLVSHLLAE